MKTTIKGRASLGVRGVGSSNLPVPTIVFKHLDSAITLTIRHSECNRLFTTVGFPQRSQQLLTTIMGLIHNSADRTSNHRQQSTSVEG